MTSSTANKRKARGSGRKWRAFDGPEVAAAFGAYPEDIRSKLMDLRQLIFATAETTEGVGELEEALRWGQPSYLTSQSKSGTTLRIDSKEPGQYGLYVHCQTDLIDRFGELYPVELRYSGSRAILFDENDSVPESALRHCISLELTYHSDKGRRKQ